MVPPKYSLWIAIITLMFATTLLADKPRVAVVEFDVNSIRAQRELGTTMADLLIHALVQTGRYAVLERSVLDKVRQEQDLVFTGEVDAATGAQFGKLIGAEYLVVGSVTRFEEKTSGGGVGGLLSRKLAGGAGYYTSEVGVTIRVIHSSSAEIIASENIEKKSRALGLAAGTSILGFPVAGGLFKSASMQKAVQGAIEDAVKYLGEKIPSEGSGSGDVPLAALIQINASGVNFGTLKKLTDLLEGIEGVSNVTKSFSGGKAKIELQYAGAAEELAEALYSAKTSDLNFEITGLNARNIELEMKP